MEVEAARRSKRPPWSRTVAVQVALCVAMYAAFSLGEPRFHRNRGRGGGGGVEASLGRGGRGGVSFLSVAGGARPAAEQARLLRQVRAFPPFLSPRRVRLSYCLCSTPIAMLFVAMASFPVVSRHRFPSFRGVLDPSAKPP
jgi:hypothetical protein